ncbi:MAG: Ig-like domain repeat protein [Anaerolineales bacterium]
MQHLPKHHKWIVFFIALLAALGIAAPVLADYLGPDRVVTRTVDVCKIQLLECREVKPGQWSYKSIDAWLCSNEAKPWKDYDNVGPECGASYNGRKYWREHHTAETTTTALPEATITGTLENCTLQNGWCGVTAPVLVLSAHEPLEEHIILLIEGTRNAAGFACELEAASCSISLLEGDNSFTYWALSSWGDSSQMGTTTARVDTVPPDLGLDVSGARGADGWYVSPTGMTATGADATSGLASLALAVDGGDWQASATLNEGVHTVAVSGTDNAGNVSNTSTTISVDTTTPAINVTVAGTPGDNGWYKAGAVQVSAAASDATSGVGTFEVSPDGAAYQPYAPVSFADGEHTVRFRAVDRAGNLTETPVQVFHVDTAKPDVDLPASWQLGTSVQYSVYDAQSGLDAVRVVIEDERQIYAKVTWERDAAGKTFEGHIDWDGEFKDKTAAPPGTYLVTIKARDQAGNERFEHGKIIVPEPNLLLSLFPTEEPVAEPPLPPEELSDTNETSTGTTSAGIDFGGITTETTGTSTQSLLLTSGSAGATASTTSAGILWGTTAAAIIAAVMAYAAESTRLRHEAEAEQAAQVQAQVHAENAAIEASLEAQREALKIQNWLEGQAIFNVYLDQASAQGATPEQIEALEKIAATEGFGQAISSASGLIETLPPQRIMGFGSTVKILTEEAEETLEWNAALEALRNKWAAMQVAEQQDDLQNLSGYFNSEKLTPATTTPADEPWWEDVVDFIDNHQTGTSMGIGALVGLVAVGVVLAAGIVVTLPVLILAAGISALVAGVAIGIGTVALNNHYDRAPLTNLLSNILVGSITAEVVTGIGLTVLGGLATQAVVATGNAVASACAANPTICANIQPLINLIDPVEEAFLGLQLAVQTFLGNEAGAAETALEIQMEHMDGGMPGNVVAKELGGEAIEKIVKYGDEAVTLVTLHGYDAAQIILTYGNDGIDLLLKYGDDAIELIQQRGQLAIDVLKLVGLEDAEILLAKLDDDTLNYVLQLGDDAPEALAALACWKATELANYGPELALRASRDVEALAAVKKLISLGPIDPKNLTDEQKALIDSIAELSTQYGDEGQVVLGKWIDYANGFVQYAQQTGSVHYNPHPDLWDLLGGLGGQNQGDVAWLINQRVLQTGIDKGLPFEYTLNGVSADLIDNEKAAVRAIFSGKTEAEIQQLLKLDYLPVRMQELLELKKAGYEISFDDATNSYVLILP